MGGSEVDVGRGRVHVVMAHQRLDHGQVHACLSQGRAKTVPEGVGVPGGDTGFGPVVAENRPQAGRGQWLTPTRAFGHDEQRSRRRLGPFGEEVRLHERGDVRVDRHPPLLIALADHPSPASPDVDISDLEPEDLR